MATDERKSTWTDDPQRENAELNDRVSEDLSKTPVNAGGPGALGGGASTPGPPESPAAPQPRGSIGSGENAGAAARADTAPAAGGDGRPKLTPEPDTTGSRRPITERRD